MNNKAVLIVTIESETEREIDSIARCISMIKGVSHVERALLRKPSRTKPEDIVTIPQVVGRANREPKNGFQSWIMERMKDGAVVDSKELYDKFKKWRSIQGV